MVENQRAFWILWSIAFEESDEKETKFSFSIFSKFWKVRSRLWYHYQFKTEACNFIKKRLWHRCFLVNFAKNLFYRAPLVVTFVIWVNSWDQANQFRSCALTLSWRRFLSYRNRSTDLQSKSIEWFLYDRDLFHVTLILKLMVSTKRSYILR